MASTSESTRTDGTPRSRSIAQSVSTGIQEIGTKVSQGIEKVVSIRSRASGRGSQRVTRNEDEDQQALIWASLEKLPTYERLRTSILNGEETGAYRNVDVRSLLPADRSSAIDKIIGSNPEADNEKFLQKLRDRLDKVGIELPRVELRYEHLTITAQCHVGGRALPTLWNATMNFIEGALNTANLTISKKTTLTILDDVSGVIQPARMTLLLGPPTCGKTTLLLALADLLAANLKVSGKVTYNGHEMDEFVPQKTSVYVSQMDLHQGELTVRETLDFSARCQGVGSRFDLVEELCVREKDLGICPDPVIDIYLKATAVEGQKRNFSTEYILKMLGLDVCADTVVGNNMMRGISGGQKKRTTTGEMIVGPSRVLLMDQITDGLDSSTAFQIVKCLSQLARYLDYTVIISLLQPAPEAFNLFDDILLMAEGHVVYHGPRSQAMDFFETLGFVCPPRKAVPDYLQELTSRKDQGQYWADKSKPYRFISVKELAEAFKNYPVGMNMLSTLSIPFEKSDSHKAALAFNTYGLPSKEIFKTVFERELLLMKRNSFVWIFRLGQIIFLALIAMGMYIRPRMHRRNLNDAQIFNAAQFFGITNVLFNGYLDLALTVGRLPVFFKQRQLHMFPAWTYALSVFVLGIPITLIEAPSWAGITYYTIGFAPFIGRFFRYILLLILLHTSAGAMFRAIAGLCRTMVISNSGGSAVLLLIFTLGGLLIPRKTIKSWWIWGYWISPLSYANNGISVNEFMAPQWKKYPSGLIRSLGVQYLYSVELFHRGYWYWIAILALACFAIGYNVLFGLAVTYMRPIGGPRAIIPEHELEEKQATRTGTASAGSSTSGHMKSEETRVDIEPTSRTRPGRTSPSPERHGMILPFHPYAMSFTNLSYSVEMPAAMRHEGAGDKLKLLHNITGTFRPGVLTALMGVTGAGKTTLMDVLAGRKTGGYIEGDIRISGFPKVQETFARIAGYCEQTDIHSSQVTVEESLIYSAWLRLPHEVTDEQRTQFVEEVMDLVELRDVKTGLVGIPGQTGLSHEQRKRLTIGVELVANPSIIFMDEPTSGLDARAAAIVMRAVRNTVDTGRTVVCTIHQPSIDIFESFDELVLMKRGGRLIYAGHLGRMSKDLIEYFETTVPDIPKYRDGMNPATWMLEISTPAVESRLGLDFAEIYNKSPLFEKNEAIAAELSHPVPGDTDLEFPTKFSRPWVNQFTACLWKQNRTYYRSPDYVNVRFLFTGIAAAFMGTLFWRLGHKRHSQKSIYSVMGSLYASILFIGVTNAQTIQPLIASERNAYYRERAAGMYSPLPYALAQILNEVPYAAVQGVLYTIITYPMLYLEWTASKFFWHIYFLFTVYIAFTYYGMVAVSITPSAEFASVVGSGFYQIFNLFAGFLIPKPRIPPYYVWIYWATPTAYALYGLVVSQYGDLHGPDHMMTTITGDQRSVASWVADHFDFKHGFIGGIAALSLVYPLVFGIIFTVAMTKLNFQTR